MSPLANSYLGIPGYVLFWVLFAVALGLFVQRLVLLIRLLRLGRPERPLRPSAPPHPRDADHPLQPEEQPEAPVWT